MSIVGEVVHVFAKADRAVVGKVLSYIFVYGGLALCFLASLKIVHSIWQLFTGIPYGQYYSTLLSLVSGPVSGMMLSNAAGASDELGMAVFFGWGYAPSILAIMCAEDLEETARPASAFYLRLYSGACIAFLLYILVRAVNSGGNGLISFMAITAASVLFGFYILKKDEQNKAKVLAFVRQHQARAAQAEMAASAPERPVDGASGLGPATKPYRPAPASLADDFDVPPQR